MTKKPSARLSALALAALLTGCSFIPTYERPAAPVATQWPGESAAQAAAQPVADIPWQSFFADARLRALVAEARRPG